MADFGLSLAAMFGGVFGAVVGFLVLGATAVLLALPYIMLTRRSQDQNRGRDSASDPAQDARY